MPSSATEKSAKQLSQGGFVRDITDIQIPTTHYLAETSPISQAKTSPLIKKAPIPSATVNGSIHPSIYASSKRPDRVLNNFESQAEYSSDDPPSVFPRGYKSPHAIIKEGDRIDVWWEGDDKFYRGTVRSLRHDGKRRVEYDDGEIRHHFLNREVFTLTGRTLERFLAGCFPGDAGKASTNEPVHYPGLAPFLEVGHRLKVYWQEMNRWYKGVVTAKGTYGRFHITYDDEDRTLLRMEVETFRFIEESAAIVHTRLLEKYLGK